MISRGNKGNTLDNDVKANISQLDCVTKAPGNLGMSAVPAVVNISHSQI